MAWRISDDQWLTLAQARETRPAQLSKWRGGCLTLSVLMTGLGLLVVSKTETGLVLLVPFGGLTVLQIYWSRDLTADWRGRFMPVSAAKGRQVIALTGDATAPLMRYQVIRDLPDWEWLTFQVAQRLEVTIAPGSAPIGDPIFDAVLGLTGTETQRALLGPELRDAGPRWHAEVGFIVADDQAKVKLGVHGTNHRAQLQKICAAFGRYADRLTTDPATALSTLARDLGAPFDAARALAALYAAWPDQAAGVGAAIADDPLGAAINRAASEGRLDSTLDWPTRAVVGRGVLGITGTASATLAAWLEAQTPTDDASAMALVELCETGATLLGRASLKTSAQHAFAMLIERGGPECLAWMRARAAHHPPSRGALQTITMRLNGARTGLLSLDDAAYTGALSEAQGGELAVAETPPA